MKKFFYFFLLIICFLFGHIRAQQIAVNKDSLKIYESGDTLYVYNTDDSILIIDSLYSVSPAFGYWLTISTKDSSFPYSFIGHSITKPLELELDKNDTAKFFFWKVDLCPVCKISSINEYFKDTLKVISSSQLKDTLLLFVEGDGILSSINNERILEIGYKLYQNYPDPFNSITTIKYTISRFSHVSLKVFDLLGREVQTLLDEQKPAGEYKVIFNAINLSSGVYIYTLKAGEYYTSRKLILLK